MHYDWVAIPDADVPFVKSLGYRGIFGPGTDLNETIEFVRRERSLTQA